MLFVSDVIENLIGVSNYNSQSEYRIQDMWNMHFDFI